MADEQNDKPELGLKAMVKGIVRIPEDQNERIRDLTLSIVSIGASVAVFLLRGVTSVTVLGLLIAAVFGAAGWWIQKRNDIHSSAVVIVYAAAFLSFINAIPAFRGFSTFLMGFFTTVGLLFGVWKIASTIFSVFRPQHKKED